MDPSTPVSKCTDADLSTELERRRNVHVLPEQVAAMTTLYIECGGKRADLVAVVEKAPEPAKSTPPAGTSSSSAASSTSTSGVTVGISLGTGR